MKICFLNRGRETHPGGDVIQLDATMAALRRAGVEVEETGWDVERMRAGRFDLAHVFHCNFDWSLGNVRAVQQAGLRYVLTPIYYPGPLLSGITLDDLLDIISEATAILPFSRCEWDEMGESFPPLEGQSIMLPNIVVIPNGTDRSFHRISDPMLREGVLCVSARGESDKGVPLVRSVCEALEIPFTCATGVPHADLPEIYKHRRVFVNASESERMSLTIGEALCANCRVLASTGNRGNEHYPKLVTFNPTNRLELSRLIHRAYYSPGWDTQPNHAARALTWDGVAERLIEVYKGVLGHD